MNLLFLFDLRAVKSKMITARSLQLIKSLFRLSRINHNT